VIQSSLNSLNQVNQIDCLVTRTRNNSTQVNMSKLIALFCVVLFAVGMAAAAPGAPDLKPSEQYYYGGGYGYPAYHGSYAGYAAYPAYAGAYYYR